MAMIWITRIVHSSPEMGVVKLRQNDPTYHPVIDDVQYMQDDVITIAPGQARDASWFVIPWADYGRLQMQYCGRRIDYDVGPISFFSPDHLRARDGDSGVQIDHREMGPRGPAATCSIDLWLLFHDGRAELQFQNSSGVGEIDGQQVLDALAALAEAVAAVVAVV